MNAWPEPKIDESVIKISGSDSMFQRIRLIGRLYQKSHPDMSIDVSQGGTMDSGIRDVIDGKADLAMASCSMRPDEDKLASEKGVKLVERVIGYGGITILVNSSAQISSLTLNEVKGIFSGQYKNWKQVGGTDAPIKVVRTDESYPGTLVFLENDFMRGPFVSDAIVVSTFPSVVAKVADIPNTIGYVRIRETTESPVVRTNPRVKVVPISLSKSGVPVSPERATVADHSYPLLRPYYVYYSLNAKPSVAHFVDFIVKQGWGPQEL
jgi:phosphate transport system substrate-binding protein